MRDRRMRSVTKLAREIQLTDWSTAGNLSNRSPGVQIPRDICTRFGRYLYSTKCSWIIMAHSRSFLANQKARNALFGAENLLRSDITKAGSVKSCGQCQLTFLTRTSFHEFQLLIN